MSERARSGAAAITMYVLIAVALEGCGSDSPHPSDSSTGGRSASTGGTSSTGGKSANTGGSEVDASRGGSDAITDTVHTYAPTFDAIYREIFLPTCAAAFCHNGNDELGFDALTPDSAYRTTVGVVTETENCGPTGLVRIAPGHPEKSLLYLKLTDPPCGRKMPQTYSMQLDPREIEQIRQWIERGASRKGEGPDAGLDAGPDAD